MLEEYIKRVECLIAPNYYSKENFVENSKNKEEIFMEEKKKKEISDNDEFFNKMNMEGDKDLIVTLERKLSEEKEKSFFEENKKIPNDHKIKIYQKILENEEMTNFAGSMSYFDERMVTAYTNNKHRFTMRNLNRRLSLSPHKKYLVTSTEPNLDNSEEIAALKEKIKNLTLKNVTFRNELEAAKCKIIELTQVNQDQGKEIKMLKDQNQHNEKYIDQLENLLSKTKTVSIDLTDISEKKDENPDLHLEVQKLKMFQEQVYSISRDFDNINENMISRIKEIQTILTDNNLSLGDYVEKNQIHEISVNLCRLLENVERTLIIKQSEYNFLLDTKDQIIVNLKEELVKVKQEVELFKKTQDVYGYQTCNTEQSVSSTKQNSANLSKSSSQNTKEVKETKEKKMQLSIKPVKKSMKNIIASIKKGLIK